MNDIDILKVKFEGAAHRRVEFESDWALPGQESYAVCANEDCRNRLTIGDRYTTCAQCNREGR